MLMSSPQVVQYSFILEVFGAFVKINLKLNSSNLPTSFNNVVIETNDKVTKVSSNLIDLCTIGKWMEEFSILTATKWDVRLSVPKGKYIQCKLVNVIIFFFIVLYLIELC